MDPDNPFSYTTGRWLKNDKLQREARYVKFDFAALCRKVMSKEGGFNRVFILSLDNGARVVARVPYHIAGPRRLTINSEVATMAYVRSFTKIPVPKVLDWSDDDSAIGTEYIIMEHAPGVQLHNKWLSMNPHQHMLCVKKVASIVVEMANPPFPAYGSLYLADAPINPKLKIGFTEGFCIGPHCEPRFYEERPPNRGPWNDLQSYCSALIDAGFSRIPKTDSPEEELPYRGPVASLMLLHHDLRKRNIFVDDNDSSKITAVIDRQSTSIEPLFAYANETPDLAEDPAADALILEKLMTTFEVMMLGKMRKLHDARKMDQTLLRPFRYCDASWRDSAAALRQELIELS
ncbi:hypothetical protein BU16DRAFT_603172 [Lophium mytilinum]|uniref:Altered inheritance of mitochondria protein 9, mitochondrial n=1 Tax=Lophium mytilinum TaxID=390894 RepID=A0A6A6R356_9PEZI|nr:hypothetical protein BU16DRAFT_603172 [Lophium mytilinum]